MPDITANLNLNVPFPGENVGNWHLLANPNWYSLDAVFAPLASTSPGGTGHVHNGLPGQGPQLSHGNLTDIGTKSHAQLEIDLTSIFNRLDVIETTYCADVTCGGGGGSGAEDPHPPVHYTENFTVEQGTRLAQMDWLVSSDSGNSDVQSSGHSGYLSTSMGYPFTERYAAVVKCQIPHTEAQRITYNITRVTADGLEDGDSIMMVMSLMSTHLLGASTPYIHACGIKLVIVLSKQGGTYSITRMAIAQVSDTSTTLLRQDFVEGLPFGDAELFFRGCHEWSVDENGGLWYYHNRAPVWILPAGTASPYFPQISLTLQNLNEPPYGSIGFGWAWNLIESAIFDVEMSWLTIDSKANVLEEYTTSYSDPGNTPAPFDPIVVPDMCCGGAGPQLGELVDLGEGLLVKAVACVDDPFQGVLLENGAVMPCSPMALPPSGDPGPETVDEGDDFVREVPIDNIVPPENGDYTISDPDSVLTDVRVEFTSRGLTVSGQTAQNSSGKTTPTITVTQKTDPLNSIAGIEIVEPAQIGPTITGIDIFDRGGNALSDVEEGLRQRLVVNLNNFTANPPFPKALGAELSVAGTVTTVERKRLVADNVMHVDIITPNQTPPYGNTLTVDVQDFGAVFSDSETKDVVEVAPIIRGAWATGGPPPPGPPPPAIGMQPGDTITVTLKGDHFDNGITVLVDAPDLLAGGVTFVDDTEISFDLTIGSALGFPIKMKVKNPSGLESNGGVSETLFIVGDNAPFSGTIVETEIDGTSTTPVEGQDVRVRLFHTNLPENPKMFVEAFMGATPVPYADLWDFQYQPDHVQFMARVPSGLGALPISVSLTKNQLDPTQIATGNTAVVLPEPIPTGTPALPDLSPGASGAGQVTAVGDVFYGQDIEVYAQAGDKMVVTGPVVSTPFTGLTFNYEIDDDAVPGVDTFTLVVTNRLGTSALIPLGAATEPPLSISGLEYASRSLIEGRVDTLATIVGENFRAGVTVSVVAGTVTVHDVVFVSSTEIQVQLDAPQLTGGDAFTLQVDNPAPDPSSGTVGGVVANEPTPRIAMEVKPPTPGVARVIEFVGQNLFVPDANVPGAMTAVFDKFVLDHWDVQSNGFWRGVGEVTGGANEIITLDVITPGGQNYASITSFRIRAISVTPIPVGFDPADVESYLAVDFTIQGSDFDSVAVVQAVTADLVPIGESSTLPLTITAMTDTWITGTVYLGGGLIDVGFDIEFLDSTLAVIGTLSPGFTGVQGLQQPWITNKNDPYPDESTPGATITRLFELDPSAPILDPASWSVTNGTLLSAVDTSGIGTGWTLEWENGVAGDFEIRCTNTGIVPNRFDVVRRTLA